MLPDVTFLGLDLYYWCLVLGIIAALLVARIYSDRLKVPVKLQNLVYIVAFFAIVIGYVSAVLFQAVYNLIKTGVFAVDDDTGATFYGGFIGGAAVFLLGYFLIGGKLFKNLPVENMKKVTGFAACSVAVAHGIGRIGCFFAGCCYGAVTDEWLGIYMPAVGQKVVPTQLIEAIFLLLLFVLLTMLLFKTKVSVLGVYLSAYALFRFFLEFLRDDDRGSFIGSISPSQFWAILLFLLGIGVILFFLWWDRRPIKKAEEEPPQTEPTE